MILLWYDCMMVLTDRCLYFGSSNLIFLVWLKFYLANTCRRKFRSKLLGVLAVIIIDEDPVVGRSHSSHGDGSPRTGTSSRTIWACADSNIMHQP